MILSSQIQICDVQLISLIDQFKCWYTKMMKFCLYLDIIGIRSQVDANNQTINGNERTIDNVKDNLITITKGLQYFRSLHVYVTVNVV